MIASRSCCNHENRSVDLAHPSGPGLLGVRTERVLDVHSNGPAADRPGGPVRHGIASVALRAGDLCVSSCGRRASAGEPLCPPGTHDSRPDHRQHPLVSSAAVPHGCGYCGRRCDSVGNRGISSPPGLLRPFCAEVAVAPQASAITAMATIANAGKMLWGSVGHWTIATDTLLVLDQLLVVLMMVEIMHTVRISIHSHVLVTEPFLVVGLIASIRRMLVITLEAASLTKPGIWSTEGASIFRGSMLELGLLGLVILMLVFSITLLRRYAPEEE